MDPIGEETVLADGGPQTSPKLSQSSPTSGIIGSPHFGNNREYTEFQDYSDFLGKTTFFNFLGLPVVPEGFGEVPGGGTLHPDRIRARTERYGPKSTRFS